jgi:hypothetical protein
VANDEHQKVIEQQQRVIDHLLDEYVPRHEPASARELGFLGKFFGGRFANSSIAGVVAISAFLLLVVTLILDAFGASLEYGREFVTGSFGVLGLALGYLFGSSRP